MTSLSGVMRELVASRRHKVVPSQGSAEAIAHMNPRVKFDALMGGLEIPYMVTAHFPLERVPSPPPQASRPRPSSTNEATRNRIARARSQKQEDTYRDPLAGPIAEERIRRQTHQSNVAVRMPGWEVDPSRDEQFFLNNEELEIMLTVVANRHGLADGLGPGVVDMISLATQDYLKTMIEKLVSISKYRTEIQKSMVPTRELNNPTQRLKELFDIDEARHLNQGQAEKELLEAKLKDLAGTALEEAQTRLQELEEQEEHKKNVSSSNTATENVLGGMTFRTSKRRRTTEKVVTSPQQDLSIQAALSRKIELRDIVFLQEQDKYLRKSPLMNLTYFRLIKD